MNRIVLSAVTTLVAVGVLACATNPATGRREITLMSEAQEIAIGREQDALIRQEMGVYRDDALQRYVSGIGMALAKQSERPNLPWQFTVVDSQAINAFALPGGFIYLTRGILPFLADEAELAGVLGHEIGHVTARHSAQQYTRTVGGTAGLVVLGILVPSTQGVLGGAQQALGVLFLKYGRDDELEADSLGVRYALRGNWDPIGVPGMLSTLGRLDEAAGDTRGIPNWLSTHPEPLSRVDAVTPQVEMARAERTDLRRAQDALLERLDGLIYGDSPEQGFVRGSAFLHPVLRFRMDFPRDWPIANAPTQVTASSPNGNAAALLQTVNAPAGANLRNVALDGMTRSGLEPVSGDDTTINGLPAFVGVYRGQLEGLGPVAVRAAHIRHGDTIYLLAGLSPPDTFSQMDPTFLTTVRSFRALSAAEASALQPSRVDVTTAAAGTSWAALAERAAGTIKADTLAIMNGLRPSTPPPGGSRVKIVIGG
jgi:predicted Zn-dependent protease